MYYIKNVIFKFKGFSGLNGKEGSENSHILHSENKCYITGNSK